MEGKYGVDRVDVHIEDQYYNMGDKIVPVIEIVDIAWKAMENLDIKPLVQPIRGGTDGSQLSYIWVTDPEHIYRWGELRKYEYISLNNMEKATKVIVEIARLFEKKAK